MKSRPALAYPQSSSVSRLPSGLGAGLPQPPDPFHHGRGAGRHFDILRAHVLRVSHETLKSRWW